MVRNLSASRPTPVTIEHEFRTLLVRLSYPYSARRHLLEIDSFLDRILPESVLYESYVLEVVQRIPGFVDRLNIPGTDPAALRPLYEKLKELIVKLPAVSTVHDLAKAMQTFRSGLSMLYRFLGEPDQGDEFTTERALLQDAADFDGAPGSLFIPVVERSLVETRKSLTESGYLRRISVEITGVAKGTEDVFHTQVLVLGEEGRQSNLLTAPVTAAKSLLARRIPSFRNRYFTGFVTFDELNSFHQGSSANLAMASLICCALLAYSDVLEQFVLAGPVTMTGDVNAEGEILAVDADSLRLKTEAVFFSGIRYFVVPKSQLPIAQEVLQSLRARYKNRDLTIIGLSRLEELFSDRRLARQHYLGRIRQIVRKSWKNRYQILGAAATIALLYILAKTLGPPQDNNPVSAGLRGEMLQIGNSKGETLEEIVVGSQTLQRARNDRAYDLSRICKFYDIDGDGKNEVFYLREGKRDTGYTSVLTCSSPWRKLPRWTVSFHEQFSFPSNPVDTSGQLAITGFLIDDLERRFSPKVVVAANHLQFPGFLYVLDAKTSNITAQYLNSGHIYAMATLDTGHNGRKFLLVAGYNNAFNASFLAVFDPRLISGHSPWMPSFAARGVGEGTEMYYILIPRTVLGQSMDNQSYNNRPLNFEIGSNPNQFNVVVSDFTLRDTSDAGTISATLRLTFDDSLRALVSSGTTYNHFRDLLYSQGKVRILTDPAYLNGPYRQSLMYWDGERWVHRPAINKRYLTELESIDRGSSNGGSDH